VLERLGVAFTVRPAEVEELAHGEVEELVRENALRKALAVRREQEREAVLGCDTLVSLDGVVHGKAADREGARAALRALAGRTHAVHSAVAVLLPDGELRSGHARTEVRFREIDEGLLEWYLARGEWRERAGSYAIQGAGAALVREIAGDYENVVGLPLATLLDIYPQMLGA
jgi:septum formation protein